MERSVPSAYIRDSRIDFRNDRIQLPVLIRTLEVGERKLEDDIPDVPNVPDVPDVPDDFRYNGPIQRQLPVCKILPETPDSIQGRMDSHRDNRK